MYPIVAAGLLFIQLGSPQGTPGGNGTGAISGTVRHTTVKRYPTVVYIEEMSGKEFAPPAVHPTLTVKRNSISPQILPIVAGTTVDFVGGDRQKHYAFSPDGEKYELRRLSKGQKESYTFKNAGVYTQLCTHHSVVGHVVVLRTPYFAVADESGNFQIPNVPTGSWKLKVWNRRLGPSQLRISYDVNVVAGQAARMEITVPPFPGLAKFWLEPPPPNEAKLVERGQWLFRQKGCFLCHGLEGNHGVPNRNYVKGTIPALNTLAEKLLLFDPEDVSAIVEEMEKGRDLESLADSPPVPRFNAFLAQYRAVRDLIHNGNIGGKKDPKGPTPPIAMPSWASYLSKQDIDALIAYLLTLQPWPEEEQ